MVKSIIVVTDMEFNKAIGNTFRTYSDWGFYDQMVEKYNQAGYTIPNIVFWNASSNNNTYHTSFDVRGVQMVSGHSTANFKYIVKCVNETPYEIMREVIDSERYTPITIA